MRVVVTDTGWIWNHKNPILEKFGEDVVLVVCLNGRAVTKKYQCFVSPYQQKMELGMDAYGTESRRYQALESVADKLDGKLAFSGDPDVLFLTDGEMESLYPLFALKDRKRGRYQLHLCAMSPWLWETKKKRDCYRMLLSDLTGLKSIVYFDSNRMIKEMKEKADSFSIKEYLKTVGDEYVSLIPKIVKEIEHLREPSYFDFTSMSYIPIKDGMKKIDLSKLERNLPSMEVLQSVYLEYSMPGVPYSKNYPNEDVDTKNKVERLIARTDGKQICQYLREQRIKLAQANGIEFSSEECPSIGACAGTCAKCDEEAEYLRKKLDEIPEEKQIIPDCTLMRWEGDDWK